MAPTITVDRPWRVDRERERLEPRLRLIATSICNDLLDEDVELVVTFPMIGRMLRVASMHKTMSTA